MRVRRAEEIIAHDRPSPSHSGVSSNGVWGARADSLSGSTNDGVGTSFEFRAMREVRSVLHVRSFKRRPPMYEYCI